MAFRSRLQNKSGGSSIEQLEIEMCSPSSSPPVPVSPVCTTILPRKLRFASPSRDEDDEGTSGSDDSPFKAKSENSNDSAKTPTTMSISPPYRKVRALRLFDTPATPKTILEHCGPAKG